MFESAKSQIAGKAKAERDTAWVLIRFLFFWPKIARIKNNTDFFAIVPTRMVSHNVAAGAYMQVAEKCCSWYVYASGGKVRENEFSWSGWWKPLQEKYEKRRRASDELSGVDWHYTSTWLELVSEKQAHFFHWKGRLVGMSPPIRDSCLFAPIYADREAVSSACQTHEGTRTGECPQAANRYSGPLRQEWEQQSSAKSPSCLFLFVSFFTLAAKKQKHLLREFWVMIGKGRQKGQHYIVQKRSDSLQKKKFPEAPFQQEFQLDGSPSDYFHPLSEKRTHLWCKAVSLKATPFGYHFWTFNTTPQQFLRPSFTHLSPSSPFF